MVVVIVLVSQPRFFVGVAMALAIGRAVSLAIGGVVSMGTDVAIGFFGLFL